MVTTFIFEGHLVANNWVSSYSRPHDKRGIWEYNGDYYLMIDPGFDSHYLLYRSVGGLTNFLPFKEINVAADSPYFPLLTNANGSLSWTRRGNKLYCTWKVITSLFLPNFNMMVGVYDFDTNVFTPQINTSVGFGTDLSDINIPSGTDPRSSFYSYHISEITSTGKVFICHSRNAQLSGRTTGGLNARYTRPGVCIYDTNVDSWVELDILNYLLISPINTLSVYPLAMVVDYNDDVHIYLKQDHTDGAPSANPANSLYDLIIGEDGTIKSLNHITTLATSSPFITSVYPILYTEGANEYIALAYSYELPLNQIQVFRGDLSGSYSLLALLDTPADEFNTQFLSPYGYGLNSMYYFNNKLFVFYETVPGVAANFTGKLYYTAYDGATWSGPTLIHEEFIYELGNPVPSNHNGKLYLYFAGTNYTDIDPGLGNYQNGYIWEFSEDFLNDLAFSDTLNLRDNALVQLRDALNFPLITVGICPDITVSSVMCAGIKTAIDSEVSITSCDETIFTETTLPC